jgi:hypothetical protein
VIPGTAIPTTRLTVDDSVQPVKMAQAVADLLSEFTPGQRLVATIQSQLPNGAYRAMIAQRDVTLALPFAAKSGDTLELEVVESQGRLTFAVVADPTQNTAVKKESVTATLSQTAQLINTLLPGKGKEAPAQPAILNGGQPLSPKPPESTTGLPAVLFKSIRESGVFYESHQAAWVNGTLPKAALLAEPQGQLPPLTAATTPRPSPGPAPDLMPPATATTATPTAAQHASVNNQNVVASAPPTGAAEQPFQAAANQPSAGSTIIRDGSPLPTTSTTPQAPLSIPAEVAPLVQQQLSALASNVYAWQGLAWPGQNIEWEIVDEEGRRQSRGDPDAPPQWQTRLRLSLPSLGAVDAMLTLRGDQVDVDLVSRRNDARQTMLRGAGLLREQFVAAGLQLGGMAVKAGETDEQA